MALPKVGLPDYLEVGRRAHEKEATIKELAEEFSTHKSSIYNAQREYRRLHNLPIPNPRGKHAAPKKLPTSKPSPEKEARPVAVNVAVTWDDEPLLARIRELENLYDQVLEECDTLRTIVMALGRTLKG